MKKTTLIIGASHKPERYSNKAQRLLSELDHHVLLFNPRGGTILDLPVIDDLTSITEQIDTVTLYVNPKVFAKLLPNIISLSPRRIIFNPGTEDDLLEKQVANAGIIAEQACTLVLLNTGQY